MPISSLEDFPAHLAAISREEWKTLFERLPELEKAKDFGAWQFGKDKNPPNRQMPFIAYSDLVGAIQDTLYELGLIIGFDWPDWNEGREIFRRDPFTVDDLDAVTLCKLITAVVRSDRFYEGALLNAFDSGQMQILFNALQQKIES